MASTGLLLCSQALLPSPSRQGEGSIIDPKCIGIDTAGTPAPQWEGSPQEPSASSRHGLRFYLQLGGKQHLPQARFDRTHAPCIALQGKTSRLGQTAS